MADFHVSMKREPSILEPFRRQLPVGTAQRITFFGDSISELDRSPAWFGGASLRAAHYGESCVRLIRRMVPASLVQTVYLGRGGENTRDGLLRLGQVQEVAPAVAVVAFGANDLDHRPLSAAESAVALRQLLEELLAHEVPAVVMAAASGDPSLARWAGAGELVATQAELCATLNLPFVNTWQELYWRKIAGDTWSRYCAGPDDCHPNDRGHALWGHLLAECLLGQEIDTGQEGQ